MEPKPDETGTAIVPVLACVLNQLCIRNDRLPLAQRGISKFHALRPPAISIRDYLTRIGKYAACSGECFVLALVYIDRIIQSNPTFVVNSLNIHRLLITSVMLAAKFFDDQYFNNAYYAKVGGVPCNEMNLLEVEFLFMTNFTLFVSTDTYRQYYTELCNHALNTACGCSTQRIPILVIPPGKFDQLTYRHADASDELGLEEGGDGDNGEADTPSAMITSSDSPQVAARSIRRDPSPAGSRATAATGHGLPMAPAVESKAVARPHSSSGGGGSATSAFATNSAAAPTGGTGGSSSSHGGLAQRMPPSSSSGVGIGAAAAPRTAPPSSAGWPVQAAVSGSGGVAYGTSASGGPLGAARPTSTQFGFAPPS